MSRRLYFTDSQSGSINVVDVRQSDTSPRPIVTGLNDPRPIAAHPQDRFDTPFCLVSYIRPARITQLREVGEMSPVCGTSFLFHSINLTPVSAALSSSAYFPCLSHLFFSIDSSLSSLSLSVSSSLFHSQLKTYLFYNFCNSKLILASVLTSLTTGVLGYTDFLFFLSSPFFSVCGLKR